jgi:hypothetical protein
MSCVVISAPQRKQIPHQQVRDPNYWGRRRAWWREHKQRTGCDWAGVNHTQIEVAAFLADLRKRCAS